MKFIDTHTHINLQAFSGEEAEVIHRAVEAGVSIINVGTQIDTSRQAALMVEKFPQHVYAAVGLHPSHAYEHNFLDYQELNSKTPEPGFDYEVYKQLALHPKVVGIGECGLDYFRVPDAVYDQQEIKQKQKQVFLNQLELALELDKALCIHCRPSQNSNDAYEDLFEILTLAKDQNPNLRFEVHCFTGSLKIAQKFVDLGGYLGVNGIITFDKTGQSEEVVKNIPLQNLLLETDAPYLSPKSKRGKRNEPSFIIETAQKIAEWKGLSLEKVAKVTTANANNFFKINE